MVDNNELLEKLNQYSEEEAKNIKGDWLESAKSGMKWAWIIFAFTVAFFLVILLMQTIEDKSPTSTTNVMTITYYICPIAYLICCLYGLHGFRAAHSLKLVEGGYTKETKKYAVLSIIPSFIITLPFIGITALIAKAKAKKQ